VLNTDQRRRIAIRSVDPTVLPHGFTISDASADPLGRDPLARRDEKSLGHLLRNSFERTDKTPAGDARLSQALSFDFYLIAFHPCNGNVEAQFRVPLELVRVRLFYSEPDAAQVQF
jgi:hypothetical protein